MAASCAQDGPRWRQDGHLGLNTGGFGAILCVTWTILEGLGEDLGGVLAHGWESKNLDFRQVFQGFSLFGRLGRLVGTSWRPCSSSLARLGENLLESCGQDARS